MQYITTYKVSRCGALSKGPRLRMLPEVLRHIQIEGCYMTYAIRIEAVKCSVTFRNQSMCIGWVGRNMLSNVQGRKSLHFDTCTKRAPLLNYSSICQ